MASKRHFIPIFFHEFATGYIMSNHDLENNDSTTFTSLKKYIYTDVDGDRSTVPLCAYCFMTGFVCVFGHTPHPCTHTHSDFSGTQSVSLRYLCGVHFKPGTPFRCVSIWDPIAQLPTRLRLALTRPRPPFQWSTRLLFPSRRPASSLFTHHIHLWRIHGPHWR